VENTNRAAGPTTTVKVVVTAAVRLPDLAVNV
jgi:hypothetical protein